jgi:hypothetical protein
MECGISAVCSLPYDQYNRNIEEEKLNNRAKWLAELDQAMNNGALYELICDAVGRCAGVSGRTGGRVRGRVRGRVEVELRKS